MKSIKTLVADVYSYIENPPEYVDGVAVGLFVSALGKIVSEKLSAAGRQAPRLRVSNLGERCDRKLWYSVNRPELAEPLSAPTRIKFLFGDILEQLLLLFARLAGHAVENEQQRIEVDDVVGHIDATVDQELVDCKSASTFSFSKFSKHELASDDPFGYLVQLGAYGSRVGSGNNHFLAIDKQHGHIVLDSWAKSTQDYTQLIKRKRAVLANPVMPERGYTDEPHQKSGNRKLGVSCSYCSFKSDCWSGLRVFSYSGRPVFLTRVVREPRVNEAD